MAFNYFWPEGDAPKGFYWFFRYFFWHDSGEMGTGFVGDGNKDKADGDDYDGVVDDGGGGGESAIVSLSSRQWIVGGGGDDGVVSLRGIPAILLNP